MGDGCNIISGQNSNAYGIKGVGDDGFFVEQTTLSGFKRRVTMR